eukprot:9396678-Pyramimonas_sp.AAC.1
MDTCTDDPYPPPTPTPTQPAPQGPHGAVGVLVLWCPIGLHRGPIGYLGTLYDSIGNLYDSIGTL